MLPLPLPRSVSTSMPKKSSFINTDFNSNYDQNNKLLPTIMNDNHLTSPLSSSDNNFYNPIVDSHHQQSSNNNNNNNTNNNDLITSPTSSSSSSSSISLDKYHEPSSMEKLHNKLFLNSNTANNSISLPPISSFDNLVRAAEKQYKNSNSTTTKSNTNTMISTTTSSSRSNSDTNISMSFQDLASSANNKKISKPRKKKQCPICNNFYANLSTHKSTHLTPEDRPHRCPVCERGFARNNDLIRHKKRHWKDEINVAGEHDQLKSLHQIKGTFKCPYNSTLIQLDMEIYPFKSKSLNFETSNCHQTGIFSRCDTFKNHLKALHFEYPPGTKKKDRNVVSGRCKHCGLKFDNVEVWLSDHVGKTCGYIYH